MAVSFRLPKPKWLWNWLRHDAPEGAHEGAWSERETESRHD
jgi:hypothetical protein